MMLEWNSLKSFYFKNLLWILIVPDLLNVIIKYFKNSLFQRYDNFLLYQLQIDGKYLIKHQEIIL